ncbi:tyrosine-type recombinase/integrase [Undibacterium terreum]|uniref:tyrosine-type recombinase/integrase n=1 Tax=Undibacterium terreum TaxID=1224302 RepID=UPI0016683194|nr:tyrosine-type recombinase/integrase [Undibacterium terreum]
MQLNTKRKSGSILAAQAYIRLKLLTGLWLGDLLRITMSDIQEDGLHVTPRKTESTTGKTIIYAWSDELRGAVALAKSVRPREISPYLFCTLKGECYFKENGRAGGWESLWRNFMARVFAETQVTERFTEHDLRAKCASDADSLAHAQQLLGHADSKVTQRVYRRKAEIVQPLR